MDPWWFLLLNAIGLAVTVNALHSIRGRTWLVVPSFFAGWLTSEAPLHFLGLQVVIAGTAVAAGSLDSWPGWLGLVLCMLSCSGLVFLHREGHRAADAMEQAIADTLGEGYQEKLRKVHAVDAPLPRGRLAVPVWLVDPAVRVARAIPYVPDAGRRQQLDVYRQRSSVENAPVLFQVHGGGWVIGHKAQQARPLLYYMAARGWVCVSANYRLSPRAKWPDHLVDLKLALRWVRQHIAVYGGDPGFVVVTGGSAGGHLASILALSANDPSFQPGFEGTDTQVQGAVPIYGVYDFLNRGGQQPNYAGLRRYLERLVIQAPFDTARAIFDGASPLSRVHPDAPPFLVIHGRNDSMVCVEEARLFVERLRAVSRQSVAYAELPYAQHAFDVFYSPRTLHMIRAVHRYASALHADYIASSEA